MIVGVPDKKLNEWLKGKEYMIASDEGEAVAIVAGYWKATKKRGTVFMSADGFCNALNPLTSLVMPYAVEMNLVISTGRQESQHKVMSDSLEGILDVLNVNSKRIFITILGEA